MICQEVTVGHGIYAMEQCGRMKYCSLFASHGNTSAEALTVTCNTFRARLTIAIPIGRGMLFLHTTMNMRSVECGELQKATDRQLIDNALVQRDPKSIL